jgi:peptidyl-tRNA hydrolase
MKRLIALCLLLALSACDPGAFSGAEAPRSMTRKELTDALSQFPKTGPVILRTLEGDGGSPGHPRRAEKGSVGPERRRHQDDHDRHRHCACVVNPGIAEAYDYAAQPKVALAAPSIEALSLIADRARSRGVPYVLIEDEGRTVFGRPTVTVLGLGPNDQDG